MGTLGVTNVLENGLQVAEMLKNGELVGMVQGCIKDVGTGFVERHVQLGCILGLRVSPKHRYITFSLSFCLFLCLKWINC